MDNPSAPGLRIDEDLTGRTLEDFRVLRRLGEGGMGQVFLAEQLSLKRKIALKILRADLAANPASLQRFRTEAEAVARATHANIVQVYAVGAAEGLHYIALEYVDGTNLRDYLARKGPPPLPVVLSIMRQVAAALQRAGELGIVHRDIKPENILLNRQGEVKVADFGLSRIFAADQPSPALTQSGVAMGTPLYMSPEQIEGKPLDPRTDIYSFGVTCYHLLAGVPPFRGQTAIEVALRHLQSEPEPLQQLRPDLPAELCAVVHKMMAKRPEERYQTARDVLKDLSRVRRDRSTATATTPTMVKTAGAAESSEAPTVVLSTPTVRTKWLRRGLIASAGASILLALGIGVALGWRSERPALDSADVTLPPDAETVAEVPSALTRREQSLRAAVQEHARPQNANQFALGVGLCLELGLLYFDHDQLAEADQLFQELSRSTEHKGYVLIGRLGRGIVLSYRDQAPESDREFLDVIGDKDPVAGRVRGLVNRYPRFVQMIARAVDRNAVNLAAAHQEFPVALQDLRKARPLPGTPIPGGFRRNRSTGQPNDKRP